MTSIGWFVLGWFAGMFATVIAVLMGTAAVMSSFENIGGRRRGN